MNLSRGARNLGIVLQALLGEWPRYIMREAWRVERALPHWFDMLPLPKLMQLLDVEAKRYPIQANAAELRRLVDAVVMLDYFSPLGLCLRRSLVRYVMLRRAGVPVVIHFGAKKNVVDGHSKIAGHAWLTLDGAPYAENPDDYHGFTAIYSHPLEKPQAPNSKSQPTSQPPNPPAH